ncbi:MAG TPA: hypothetical protein VE173_07260, partial [Longimicrobiales bacterium]|nr:hypothetical protein [Longimicrobiales bacterium]
MSAFPGSNRLMAALVLLTFPLLAMACGRDGGGAPGPEGGEGGASEGELLARARDLQDRIVTIDTHDDIPTDFGSEEVNPCQRLD